MIRFHYLVINNFRTWAAVPQDDMKGSERQILTGRGRRRERQFMKGSERQILTGRGRRRERQRILSNEFKQSYGHEDVIEILMIQRLQSFSIQPVSELSARWSRLEYCSPIRYDHLRAVYQRRLFVVDAPEYQHFPGS
jgi:hypothetical protein